MRRPGAASSRRVGVCLYLIGLALLLTSWIFGNPPGSAADESSHYVRALGAGAGVLTGHAAPMQGSPNANAQQLANLNDYARDYPVPAGLAPRGFGCNAFRTTASAACLPSGPDPGPASEQVSLHASQPPLPYMLAVPGMIYQPDPQRADWAGRSALALWCLLLVAVPLAMAGRYRGRLVVGLSVALTPMAIFTGSILNPSGIEIFSSVGFLLALMALADGSFPRGSLFAATFTGLFVVMSRPFAPLWVIAGLVCAAGLVGPGTLWKGIRRRPWGSARTTGVILLGAVSTLLFVKSFPSQVATNQASFNFTEFKVIQEMAVGNFGWLDTPLPLHVADWWLQLIVLLTALALMFGTWWERLSVLLITGLSIFATYAISVYYLLPVNVGPQGRHFLPILVLQPLTCASVLARQRRAVRLLAAGVPAVLMVGMQFVGWVVNGTREGLGQPATTLGDIPGQVRSLLGHTEWSPPGGFVSWYVVLVIGCVALFLACAHTLVTSEVRGLEAVPAVVPEPVQVSESEPVAPELIEPESIAPELSAPEPVAPEPAAPEPVAPEPVVVEVPPPREPQPVAPTVALVAGLGWPVVSAATEGTSSARLGWPSLRGTAPAPAPAPQPEPAAAPEPMPAPAPVVPEPQPQPPAEEAAPAPAGVLAGWPALTGVNMTAIDRLRQDLGR